ncbi:MAG: SDR family oxidoreductase, partial [Candidatus Yanofskybacteria bacterium]|nr:SDR family oxidoreductase [Candidatus Yanofskybacteria bacterium]
KEAGVKRFIYFSSCSVYGASDNVSDETSPTNPITAYAKCKVLNEQALRKMADENFSPVLLRNATAYGLSPRMRFDLVVNNLAGLAWTTKKIAMESDGTPWRPFVHVRDISRAVISSLSAPLEIIHNQIFNVGDNRSNYQIRDIASIVEQVFPDCEVTLNKDGADKRNYRVNFDKINATLPGFSSKEDIESGVKELLKIFKQIAMDEETFRSRHYTRLKQIKHLRDIKQVDNKLFWIPQPIREKINST